MHAAVRGAPVKAGVLSMLAIGLNLLVATGPLVAHHSFAMEFDDNQFIVLNTELIDYHCAENERDVAHFLGK